jgi:dienelactone hydrolase
MAFSDSADAVEQLVHASIGSSYLQGNLTIPAHAHSVVLFAHGSGSGRQSPRNQFVATQLQRAGMATLLLDLLTEEEELVDRRTARLRFDISLLAERLVAATDWVLEQPALTGFALGYFGASTGAAAALVAGARKDDAIAAIVSRGGRPDLAGDVLSRVAAPTLLLVGGYDDAVIELNERALARLAARTKELVVVPGASHLFEEPGKLQEVARLAADWFARHLGSSFATSEGARTEGQRG